jgi:uncharacterized protein
MPRDYQKAAPTQYQRIPEHTRDENWIKATLHRLPIGHIGHIANGIPFVTPTNFYYDETAHAIIFHSNISGRTRSNLQSNPQASFVASEYGKFLPSNAALEFSTQYRAVMAFGVVEILQDDEARQRALYGLIQKYFPHMQAGREYRPITSKELAQTSVYALHIESWSGKENWQDQAEQIDDWAPLPPELLA